MRSGTLIARSNIKGEPGQFRDLIQVQDDPGAYPDFWDCYGGKETHLSRSQAVQLFDCMKIQEVSFSEAFCHVQELPDSWIESEFMRRRLGDEDQLSFEKPLRACSTSEIKEELRRRDEEPGDDEPPSKGKPLIEVFKELDQDEKGLFLLKAAALDPQSYLDPVPDDMVMEEAGRRNSAF